MSTDRARASCPHPDEKLVALVPIREGARIVGFRGDCSSCFTRDITRYLREAPVTGGVVEDVRERAGDNRGDGFHADNSASEGRNG